MKTMTADRISNPETKPLSVPTPHGRTTQFGDHAVAWKTTLDKFSNDELVELETLIAASRARRCGEPILIWDGRNGDVAERPPGGAVLHIRWAVEDCSLSDWYPTEEAAKAALSMLAKEHDRVVDRGYVDLTSPGCQASFAWVEVDDE